MKNKLFFIIFVVFLCFATAGATQHFVAVSGGQYYGPEQVVNGNWATGDYTGWTGADAPDVTFNTPGTTWACDEQNYVYQVIAPILDPTTIYEYVVVVSTYTSGTMSFYYDDGFSFDVSSGGTHKRYFTGAELTRVQLLTSNFNGVLESFSVKALYGG